MLVTMTYNAELFCSVCVGLILGHALFNQDSYGVRNGSEPAHSEDREERKDAKNYEGVVDAHKVTVPTVPPSSPKDAEEPLLNGLSCCGEF